MAASFHLFSGWEEGERVLSACKPQDVSRANSDVLFEYVFL